MLKKPLLLCLLSATFVSGAAIGSNASAMTSSIAIQQNQQEKNLNESAQESSSASASASVQAQTPLDRSGLDRASVHLQILQQSSTHFSESNAATAAKKNNGFDKKAQLNSKPGSSTGI